MAKLVGYWRPLKANTCGGGPAGYWTSPEDDKSIRWAAEPGYVSASDLQRAGAKTREEYVSQRVARAREQAAVDFALPIPVPGSLSADEAERIAAWLDGGTRVQGFASASFCRCCGQMNGRHELERNGYRYPSGLAHYVRDHLVSVPGLEVP